MSHFQSKSIVPGTIEYLLIDAVSAEAGVVNPFLSKEDFDALKSKVGDEKFLLYARKKRKIVRKFVSQIKKSIKDSDFSSKDIEQIKKTRSSSFYSRFLINARSDILSIEKFKNYTAERFYDVYNPRTESNNILKDYLIVKAKRLLDENK